MILKPAVISFLLFIQACAVFAQTGVKDYRAKVEESYRHDVSAYTQGLFFYDGSLYESTGQYGESSFRKVDLTTGKVMWSHLFPEEYFIEGSCALDGRVYILTWHEGTCFVYSLSEMEQLAEFRYRGQGWGLTTDGESLIMSDGTSTLTFRDPVTFIAGRTIEVTLGGRPVYNINELEYIDGSIWANLYGSGHILIIDPLTGKVTGRIDCTRLLDGIPKLGNVDVLNGIAYNAADGSVYVTGKYWPRIFRISIEEK